MNSEYLSQFFIIAFAHLVAVVSPGPDFALIVKQSLVFGRKAACFTSLGIATGILVHIFYCILGIAFFLSSHKDIFVFFKILCSGYLLYLGFTSLISKGRYNNKDYYINNKKQYLKKPLIAYKEGFFTNVLNLKATIFFLSLYSFINPETPKIIQGFYGIWMSCITGIWFILLSLFLTNRLVNNFTEKYVFYINKIMGIILIYIAIKIYLNS